MKKIIEIGGEQVVFESNGLTPLLYKQAFKTDYFSDLIKAAKMMSGFSTDLESISYEALERLDTTILVQLVWACARTADKTIKPMMEWVEDHPDFNPLVEGAEIMELIQSSMETKKNYQKNTKATKS